MRIVPECVDAPGIGLFLLVDAVLFAAIISIVRRWQSGGRDDTADEPPPPDGRGWLVRRSVLPYAVASVGSAIGGAVLAGGAPAAFFSSAGAPPPAQ